MGDRQRRYAPPARRQQHSALTFWLPLVVTSTLALGGLAAWVWSERSEHDEEEYAPDKPPRPRPGEGGPQYSTQGAQPYSGPSAGVGGGAPPGYAGPIPSQSAGPQGGPAPAPGGGAGGAAADYYSSRAAHHDEQQDEHDQTFFGQVRGVMRRTPSPQQFMDQASKQVTAGLAAAGSALGSIMEDDEQSQRGYGDERRRVSSKAREEREGFSDHERWSEEADERIKVREMSAVEAESERRADAAVRSRSQDGKGKARARKSVAIVVSADTNMDGKMDDADIVYDQHAASSILSHLPEHHDPSRTDLFVLIYAPGMQSPPPTNYRPSTMDVDTASNLGSSYSAVNTPGAGTPAVTPGSELQSISPRIDPQSDFKSPGRQFDALYTQALSLVDSPTKILCFTSPSSYIPILRHLSPQLAYVSDLLSGHEGETIAQLKGWVGQTVLVVGDDGTGGLAESDTEMETDAEGPGGERRKRRSEAWYERSNLVGLGKGMEVVDAARTGDDWVKRVSGRD